MGFWRLLRELSTPSPRARCRPDEAVGAAGRKRLSVTGVQLLAWVAVFLQDSSDCSSLLRSVYLA